MSRRDAELVGIRLVGFAFAGVRAGFHLSRSRRLGAKPRLSADEIDALVYRHSRGETVAGLAECFEVCPQTVRNVLLRRGGGRDERARDAADIYGMIGPKQ